MGHIGNGVVNKKKKKVIYYHIQVLLLAAFGSTVQRMEQKLLK